MGMYDQNNQGGGSSFFTRIMTALIIAGVAWFMYSQHVEENPVTKEKQHVAISPDQEVKLGLESAPQMADEMGGELSESDPREQEVQKIGQILVSHSAAKNSPWNFQFHLLEDNETINAFALPGGQVFITLGLYNKLQNEAQLAGVLGHEMGHVIERHTAQQMAKSQLGKLLVTAFGAAVSDPSSGNQNPAVIAAYVNQMIQLKYSRHDESQADEWGLKLMEASGYNPWAMVDVMEVLKSASGGRGDVPSIFQSHPDPDLRIQQIKAYLKAHPPAEGLSNGGSIKKS
jgi:predicted Zn-dependent protease